MMKMITVVKMRITSMTVKVMEITTITRMATDFLSEMYNLLIVLYKRSKYSLDQCSLDL